MSWNRVAEEDIQYDLVCLQTGAVLEVLDGEAAHPRTEALAAAASELLRAGHTPDWSLLLGRLGSQESNTGFREIVLISPDHVHIVERISDRVALVAVSLSAGNLGEALSGLRDRVARVRAA